MSECDLSIEAQTRKVLFQNQSIYYLPITIIQRVKVRTVAWTGQQSTEGHIHQLSVSSHAFLGLLDQLKGSFKCRFIPILFHDSMSDT